VRAAYGFLAHNYDVGDDIYFFGFSRGAYTARAIASLVAETGLLTKRGMDHFSELYNRYYDFSASKQGRSETPDAKKRAKEYIRRLGPDQISPQAADAIRIVGVWDTVSFHMPLLTKVPFISRTASKIAQERIEFSDTMIPSRIEYGFHALALDEVRSAYRPTLWTLPRYSEKHRQPTLRQVWFSGVHTDVGGGRKDHRLSDITLAWMISECSNTQLLAFDPEYLFNRRPQTYGNTKRTPWATEGGKTQGSTGIKALISGKIERMLGTATRWPLSENDRTNETIHASIADRKFGNNVGPRHAKKYESDNLEGWLRRGWQLKQAKRGNRRKLILSEAEVGRVEMDLKDNIRSATDL
jgi:uncharacterized protein (DUF2235 family)